MSSGTAVTAVPSIGYHFVKWSDESTSNPRIDASVTADLSVEAVFEINTYTVTFKDWDGAVYATQTVDYGTDATAPASPSRIGYTFEGWDKVCTNIKSDLTITAQYSINKYTITFNTNGGTEVESITQDYGTQVIPPSAPEKEGYRFIGWNPEMPTVMPSENITLVAQYSVPSQLSQVVLPDALIKTAYFDITLDDFIIYDQKGELVNLIEEYWIEILGDSELTISNSIISIASGTTRIYAPNVIGYYDLVFLLKDPNGNVLSTQSTTIQVVNSTDITSYQIEPISNVYAKIETNGSLADKTAYYKPINIVGRTSSGISVQLVYDPATGLPADILMITSTNNSFSFVVHNGKKHLTTTYDSTASSISTTIKIFTGQGEVGSTTVTASSVAPYMHNVYFEQTSITLSRSSALTKNFLDYLKAKDQYGVNYDLDSVNIYYMTTNSSIISVDNTSDTFTLVATGACTLRAYFAATDRTVEMVVNVTGDIINEERFAIEVTGSKTIKVTFAESQDITQTSFSLLKNSIEVSIANIQWESQNKILILSSDTLFEGGNYILNINTQSIGLTIESERATGLIIDSNIIFARSGFQDTNIHLVNQYGEKMSFGADNIIGETSLGTLSILDDTINIQISPSDIGKQIAIHVRYLPRNFELTTIVTVVEDQILSDFIFYGPIDLGEESRLYGRLTSGTEDNTLAFKALDQYGNVLDLTAAPAAGDFTLVVSGADAPTVAKGKVTLNNIKEGTFSIRAITLTAGNISELYTETVYAEPALASFDVTVPDGIYVSEAAKFAISGVDQYGNPYDVTPDSTWVVQPLSTSVTVNPVQTYAKNELGVTFTAKGSADLYITNGSLSTSKAIT
ncbi:MAG: InlB B-repeat-containing protein, partial [Candidatus Pacebacteria bacterium]|nr:InlB B-repeat-containing protein [Candidatus Paceibacterota bacterium]